MGAVDLLKRQSKKLNEIIEVKIDGKVLSL